MAPSHTGKSRQEEHYAYGQLIPAQHINSTIHSTTPKSTFFISRIYVRSRWLLKRVLRYPAMVLF